MFVRKKKNRSRSISVQIIDKSYGKYRVIKTVGSASNEGEIGRLYLEALEEVPRMFHQLSLSLFDQKEVPQSHSVEDLSNDSSRLIISYSSRRAKKDQANRAAISKVKSEFYVAILQQCTQKH